jgi:hypothetical protein
LVVVQAGTLKSLNDALNVMGIYVKASGTGGPDGNEQWSVSDGRSLLRFVEGVKIPGKGPQHAMRAQQMFDSWKARTAALFTPTAPTYRMAKAPPPPARGYQGGYEDADMKMEEGEPAQRGSVFDRLGVGQG